MTEKVRQRATGGINTALCHARANALPPAQATARDTRRVGACFERHARRFLERERLGFVAANVTVRGAELDLVMREADGTLVFVEVRARARPGFGGAAASIGRGKQRRLLHAAQIFWASRGGTCACRFDVVAFEAGRLIWIRDAFRADVV